MLQNLRSYKERQFIIFEFDNGKTVKYDLSTGGVIGKKGKPVKSLTSQLAGFSLTELIGTFPDENYRNFLNYVNKKENKTRYGSDKFINIGTLLSKVSTYSRAEQYFACGITKVGTVTTSISDVPKGLIKLCKDFPDLEMNDTLISGYKENFDLYNVIIPLECYSLTIADKLAMLGRTYDYMKRGYTTYIGRLMEQYNYNMKSLVTYLDNLVTYEGVYPRQIIGELGDYCRMMKELSPKFEKYPRNFLTSHRIAIRNYERLKMKFDEEAFAKVRDTKLQATIDDFRIIYPETTQDIKDEAVQQANCVASYISKVISGDSHILFGRYRLTPENSVLTIEVRDYKVIQVKGKHNRDLTEKEQGIIDRYNQRLANLKARRESGEEITDEEQL